MIIMNKMLPRPAAESRVRATRAKQRFAELMEAAARGPVAIERHGRVIAYVLSRDDFEELSGTTGVSEPREAKRRQQTRDRVAVHAGRASSESMRLIPSALARTARIKFKPVVFDD